VVIERYEVRLPTPRFKVDYVTRLADRSYEDYKSAGAKYLVTSSLVFGPVLENPAAFKELYDRHMSMLTLGKEVARFAPTPQRPGPELLIIEVQ
jgi:hypothetical protein